VQYSELLLKSSVNQQALLKMQFASIHEE